MKKTELNDEFLRKRKERQRKIKKRRLRIFSVFLIFMLITIAVILSLTVLFPIKNITSNGSKIYGEKDIVNSCGISVGDNLFSVSEKSVLQILKQKLPFVENVRFERVLPDTLKIKVTDAKEYACYKTDEKYYTVSKTGWTLAQYDEMPKNVILIVSDAVKCKVGSEVEFSAEDLHKTAQNIIDLLQKYDISINYVDLTDNIALSAMIEGRFIVNFGTSSDMEYKIKHLNSMIKEIGEKSTGKINLSMWSSQNTQGTFVETDIK